ncbi:hypothetical protein A2U01_0090488, partial [Trifolium medium]|nr:hypothetical protein [Trifolium medium]
MGHKASKFAPGAIEFAPGTAMKHPNFHTGSGNFVPGEVFLASGEFSRTTPCFYLRSFASGAISAPQANFPE